ncbi:MAG: MFS transporter [Hyphomicrobiales bacterium]|nr:MFS transporter [Hyphomicrobiales bacterium]
MPRAIWALGFTSLLMDVSSEAIHALLPLYLTGVLGLSTATLGLIEGAAEGLTQATKIFSGAFSDWLGRRKLPAMIGYGLAALTKPAFALAVTPAPIVAAHIVDRIGKGVRGAPRDALIADLTPEGQRGAAYGLRQALDTIGGVIGPLAAVWIMLASGDNYRLVFGLACLPALAAVLILFLFVPADSASNRVAAFPLSAAAARRLPAAFWTVVALGAGMAMARIAEAFLVLRATGLGLDVAYAPSVLIGMSVVYGMAAYPAGALADTAAPRALVAFAFVSLALAEATLAAANGLLVVFVGIAIWGAHMALSQGLLAKLVADRAPPDLRGTAFGLFNLANALGILVGNAVFGAIWSSAGAATAYGCAAVFAALVAGLTLASPEKIFREPAA